LENRPTSQQRRQAAPLLINTKGVALVKENDPFDFETSADYSATTNLAAYWIVSGADWLDNNVPPEYTFTNTELTPTQVPGATG
jgi:hypothetical protein